MPCRFVALVWGLLLATSAAASGRLPFANVCRAARATVPVDALVGQLATSPEHAVLLADAGNGRLTALRRKLHAMPYDQAARWRQSAMMFAIQAGQPDVVAALLDDGADANATARLPGSKPGFLRRALGPSTWRGFARAGMLDDHETSIGPALPIAASCGDVATVDVLLRHHADVMGRAAPNVGDALSAAVMQGDATIVQRLLDHGADACADDQHLHQRQLESRRDVPTLAELGQRAGLPASLTTRLTCRTTAVAR